MATGFKSYHPWVNVMFFISVITFGMLFLHPVCLFVSFFASVCLDIRLKGKKAVKEIFTFILPMLIFVTLINGIFNHYGMTVLYEISNGNNITLEAYIYGFVLGLTVVTTMLWFFCFNEIVTADKIMFVLGKGIPKLALVVTMALRFVPLYRRKYTEISQAQKGFMQSDDDKKILNRIRNAVKSVSILVTWALENAIQTSDSMRARSYGENKRSFYSRFRFTKSDGIVMTTMIIADIVVAVCKFKNGLYASYNPYILINSRKDFGITYIIKEINTVINPLTAFEIITVVFYILLCFLPLIIDLKEELNWRRLKSKI
ncbi:MAG: hypothetical protein E7536_07585 [Ruminococcaceae bacterium]|nr:hypothetical protein [Oscillospiraceae bacterium]